MNPLISVVIPVYNGSNFMAQAIDSALAQTYKNVEVVVVNDGSRDGGRTDAIARSYGGRIRYFSQPNGGCGSALNLGVANMRGEYFSWLSHDDVYYPDKLRIQVDWMRANDRWDDVLYGDFDVIGPDGKIRETVRMRPVEPRYFRAENMITGFLHGCAMLVPAKCFGGKPPFNPSLRTTQDYDLWLRLAKTWRFSRVPGVFIQAREHPDRASMKAYDRREVDDLCAAFLADMPDSEVEGFRGWSASRYFKSLGALYALRKLPRASALAYERGGGRLGPRDAAVYAWLAGKAANKVLGLLRRPASAPLRS
ncbi:MAG: glycosyltransferase [Elusimicrobia bacterium]|nr:glycosyltransferase [Elusimicrobiota bacterium]